MSNFKIMNFIKFFFKKKKRKKLKYEKIYCMIKKNNVSQNVSILYNNDNLLSKLCELHGTDKGYVDFKKKTTFGWKPHTYSLFYNNLFAHCRNNVKLVFECGIGTNNLEIESNMSCTGVPGASLRVWKDYFCNAQIFGSDIDKNILFEEDRIKTFYVNQLDKNSIRNMWFKINCSNFDLIIDDGLHTVDASMSLFLNSFHKLRRDGIYIIEDVNFENLHELKTKLVKYNPEVVILKNEYYDANPNNNNNLIIIRKV